jgi:hypothetical protein
LQLQEMAVMQEMAVTEEMVVQILQVELELLPVLVALVQLQQQEVLLDKVRE